MSWALLHAESERLAIDARLAARSGEHERANELYKQAAVAERDALSSLDTSKPRTRG